MLPSISRADTFSDLFNQLKPSVGVIYTVREKQAKELQMVDVAIYQNPKYQWVHLAAQVGYAPSSMAEAGLDYDFGNLSQFHITIPVVSQIDIKIGYGYGRVFNDSKKWDGGPTLTGTYKF